MPISLKALSLSLFVLLVSGCGPLSSLVTPKAGDGSVQPDNTAVSGKFGTKSLSINKQSTSGCVYQYGALMLTLDSDSAAQGQEFSVAIYNLTSKGGTFTLDSTTNQPNLREMHYSPDLTQTGYYSTLQPNSHATVTIPPFACSDYMTSNGKKTTITATFTAHFANTATYINPTDLDVTNGTFTCTTTAVSCP